MDMCPEKERYLREYRQQVDPYESVKLEGIDTGTLDHALAVKDYAPSSAYQVFWLITNACCKVVGTGGGESEDKQMAEVNSY